MASVTKSTTITEYASFVSSIYSIANDRYYTLWDMLSNIQRFAMRSVKGVRKHNTEKTKFNTTIALSWFTSLMNQLHIDMGEIIWKRFPYMCSYCGEAPCRCKEEKVKTRRKISGDESKRPRTLEEFQVMFGRIYPKEGRTTQDAAIHFAEETGELSEAFHAYMGDRSTVHLERVYAESADFFSCAMGLLNSVGADWLGEVSTVFAYGCHVCHKIPCVCTFDSVVKFRS